MFAFEAAFFSPASDPWLQPPRAPHLLLPRPPLVRETPLEERDRDAEDHTVVRRSDGEWPGLNQPRWVVETPLGPRRVVSRGKRIVTLPQAPKSPNSVTSTSVNTVHSLPKHLRFEHGSAKLVSCPGRHLTSLRLWVHDHHSSMRTPSSPPTFPARELIWPRHEFNPH